MQNTTLGQIQKFCNFIRCQIAKPHQFILIFLREPAATDLLINLLLGHESVGESCLFEAVPSVYRISVAVTSLDAVFEELTERLEFLVYGIRADDFLSLGNVLVYDCGINTDDWHGCLIS